MTWQIIVSEINCPFFYARIQNNNCGHLDNSEKSCHELNCPLKTEKEIMNDSGDIDEMVDYFKSESGQTQIQKYKYRNRLNLIGKTVNLSKSIAFRD